MGNARVAWGGGQWNAQGRRGRRRLRRMGQTRTSRLIGGALITRTRAFLTRVVLGAGTGARGGKGRGPQSSRPAGMSSFDLTSSDREFSRGDQGWPAAGDGRQPVGWWMETGRGLDVDKKVDRGGGIQEVAEIGSSSHHVVTVTEIAQEVRVDGSNREDSAISN